MKQDIELGERQIQAKRQERLNKEKNRLEFKDELDALQLECVASENSLQETKHFYDAIDIELSQKKSQFERFIDRFQQVKFRLDEEKKLTVIGKLGVQEVEKKLKEREQELKLENDKVFSLKEQMFRDSQRLAEVRKNESNIISEIKGTQVSSCEVS